MTLSLFTVLFALSLGATPLATARATAAEARAVVSAVRSEQMTKRQQLNQLASQIGTLKAKAKGKLLPGGELDVALKQSQALSDELTALARTLAAKESSSEAAQNALLESLSAELATQRSQFDKQTDRNQRKALIASMRSLRVEREQVRASLPATALPKIEDTKPSDDPEDLLELADAVRDDEDRVQKKLAALENRIKEAKEERALDQRMRQFMNEDALFDEQDRRLRVQREVTVQLKTTTDVQADAPKQTPPPEQVQPPPVLSAGTPQSSDSTQGFNARATEPQPGATNETAPPKTPDPTFRTDVVRAADSRPTVGAPAALSGSEEGDLESLEAQHAQLKSLAEQLKARAKELEKKARLAK